MITVAKLVVGHLYNRCPLFSLEKEQVFATIYSHGGVGNETECGCAGNF